MIPPPHRSVTRFFIPLIDVLILLFCIFLLMPHVTSQELENPGSEIAKDSPAEMAKEVDRLRRDRERLMTERDAAVRDQSVVVLEIDSETGRLYHRGARRELIADQPAAFSLIEREQKAAPGRDVYFLLLYPRELTGFPEQRQIAAYERWFAAVPHGFDNPRGRFSGGRK